MTESEPSNATPGLIIPMGTALEIADTAESLAHDARTLMNNPTEASAEDLLTTMQLLHQRLADAFKDLDIVPPEAGESETAMPISRPTNAVDALAELRQQIIASGDVAGYLAIETQRRRALAATVARLAARVDELANRT